MAEKILKRSEVEERFTWRLEDIFQTREAWEKAYAETAAAADRCTAFDGHAAERPKDAIRAAFALQEQMMPVYEYAFLSRERDNGDTEAQSLAARAMQLYVRIQTALSFLEPELLAMPEDALQQLISDPEMSDYDTYLKSLLRRKPHTLPKAQERLLAMMGDLAQTPENVFSMLTNVDMRFPDVILPDGSRMPLTEGNFGTFREHEDRELRRQAFEGIMKTYGSYGSTIAAAYGASVRKDQTFAEARGFRTALEASLFDDQIPEAVYDQLIETVHEAIPVLNRYLALRREKLGADELHMYDLYVPIVTDYEMKLPFEEAFAMVKDALAPLGDEYLAKLQEAHDHRWMDVYPTENKSSGAFSMGSLRQVHPYVLLNHNDNLDSAFTIAHELGHSMHSWYSNTAQPFPKAEYSLFVAEVASICNEAIMIRRLLDTMKDPAAQAFLLNHFLEQFRTTCFRQTMFAEFERTVHQMAISGEPLTKETMSAVYLELNQRYYGGGCRVDDWIANEWMRIPHFYHAFYVYVYATGLCAAIALSERILKEGEPAVRDYRRFLSAGCSVPPIEALKYAGIDMSSPEPIRNAMRVFEETLDRFIELEKRNNG